MVTLTAAQGAALLAMLESDLATAAAAPLGQLISALRMTSGIPTSSPLAKQAAILQLLAGAPSAGITLGVEKQLAAMAVAGVQAWINTPPPAATPAPAAGAAVK